MNIKHNLMEEKKNPSQVAFMLQPELICMLYSQPRGWQCDYSSWHTHRPSEKRSLDWTVMLTLYKRIQLRIYFKFVFLVLEFWSESEQAPQKKEPSWVSSFVLGAGSSLTEIRTVFLWLGLTTLCTNGLVMNCNNLGFLCPDFTVIFYPVLFIVEWWLADRVHEEHLCRPPLCGKPLVPHQVHLPTSDSCTASHRRY